MKKGWTTTKLIATGSFAVLRLLLSLIGVPISLYTGIPGANGAINFIFFAILQTLVVFIIKNFGAATISGLMFGILSIPLSSFGPPGFIPKIFITGFMGFVIDIIYLLFKKNEKIAALIIGGVSQGILAPIGLRLLVLLGIPGSDIIFSKVSISLMIMAGSVGGAIFGYLGYVIYKRLKNTNVVKRIQGT